MAKLETQQSDSSRELSKVQRSLDLSKGRVEELEHSNKMAMQGWVEAKEELVSARKQIADESTIVKQSAQEVRAALDQVDDMSLKLATATEKHETAVDELNHVVTETELVKERLMNEVEMHQSTAETRLMELEQAKDAHHADVEILQIQVEEAQVEIKQAQSDVKVAKEEKAQFEVSMEGVMGDLKGQLADSKQGMEGAAIAGLGLTELLQKIKEDHEYELEELREDNDRCQEERDGAVAQFKERDKMLQQVMEHLQKQGAPAGGGDGGEGEYEDEGLQGMLDRAARDKEHMEQTMAEFEEESTRLNAEVSSLSKIRSDLQESQRRLQNDHDKLTEDKSDVDGMLADKMEMLEKVMKFIKQNGGDNGDGHRYDDDDDGAADADPFARIGEELASLSEERLRLLDVIAARDLAIKNLKSAQEQANTTMQSQKDEIEELGSQVENLTKSAGVESNLRDLLTEGEEKRRKLLEEKNKLEAERNGLSSELTDIREQLAAVSENMQNAAQGGLSLMELLAKMKEDHAVEVSELNGIIDDLEAKVQDLEGDLGEYKRRLEGLLDFLPPGEGGDVMGGDAIETLQLRLQRALEAKAALEQTLLEYEDEQQHAREEAAGLREQIARLEQRIRDLEKKLQLTEDELEQFQAGLGKVLKATRKKDDDGSGGHRYDDDDGDDAPAQKLDLAGIQDLMSSLEALQAQLAAEKEARHKVEEELASTKEDLAGKVANIQDLEEELGNSAAKIDKLIANKQKLEDFNDKLKTENAKKQKVIQDKNKEIELLKARIAELISKISSNNGKAVAKIESLQNQVLSLKTDLANLQDRMKKTLDWVKNQALRAWVPDAEVKSCTICTEDFSLLKRRHHCRICGGVFCRNCTSHKQLTTSRKKPVRSCTECVEFLDALNKEASGASTDGSPVLARKMTISAGSKWKEAGSKLVQKSKSSGHIKSAAKPTSKLKQKSVSSPSSPTRTDPPTGRLRQDSERSTNSTTSSTSEVLQEEDEGATPLSGGAAKGSKKSKSDSSLVGKSPAKPKAVQGEEKYDFNSGIKAAAKEEAAKAGAKTAGKSVEKNKPAAKAAAGKTEAGGTATKASARPKALGKLPTGATGGRNAPTHKVVSPTKTSEAPTAKVPKPARSPPQKAKAPAAKVEAPTQKVDAPAQVVVVKSEEMVQQPQEAPPPPPGRRSLHSAVEDVVIEVDRRTSKPVLEGRLVHMEIPVSLAPLASASNSPVAKAAASASAPSAEPKATPKKAQATTKEVPTGLNARVLEAGVGKEAPASRASSPSKASGGPGLFDDSDDDNNEPHDTAVPSLDNTGASLPAERPAAPVEKGATNGAGSAPVAQAALFDSDSD